MSECVHCVNRRIFYKHLDCRSSGCECSSYDRLTARIARQDKHIRTLEAQLARVRELPGKWRKEELPAAAKERRYPWKRGLLKCSGELEAALDNPKQATGEGK